jgi:hypothetical protein
MGTGVHIRFPVDEHLPARELIPLLGTRGHQVASVELRAETENPVILASAEETGSVVITADTWFLAELLQNPPGHGDCYTRAGVIQVPGTWIAAHVRLTTYLPVIEYLVALRRDQADQRVAINLSRREIRIHEP